MTRTRSKTFDVAPLPGVNMTTNGTLLFDYYLWQALLNNCFKSEDTFRAWFHSWDLEEETGKSQRRILSVKFRNAG
jgi:hypothetical protein